MAAFDTPWLASMSLTATYTPDKGTPQPSYDPNPPTIAAFPPASPSSGPNISQQRSTIIVHRKSPLLIATPPQVTRALAYSHPFILPLNRLAGLLTWTSKDPWESFLLVAGFWATTLYGSTLIRWAGPIIFVVLLILGMYSRRYSPLSSTAQTGEKHEKGHKRDASETSMRHHKSLDEIVDTLREFTTRCNILLDPFLQLTDFLSTQRTATSATTRPALTTLFIRILLVTPGWIALSIWPFEVLTTRRVILAAGTLSLTWHSRPARVARVILWRSLSLRRLCGLVTGLTFSEGTDPKLKPPPLPPRSKYPFGLAFEAATKRKADSFGVRFTFILYENQRRWLGLGWTTSLFASERGPWTDEQLNPAPSKDDFELPYTEGANARWRWIPGSEWKLEGGGIGKSGAAAKGGSDKGGGGWIYYDNKWNDGRRDADSWGRYTRRRKWYRDAELVEISTSTEITPCPTPNLEANPEKPVHSEAEDEKGSLAKPSSGLDGHANESGNASKDEDSGSGSAKSKRGWFGSKRERGQSKSSSDQFSDISFRSDRDGPEEDHVDRWRGQERDSVARTAYGLGEDAAMGLS